MLRAKPKLKYRTYRNVPIGCQSSVPRGAREVPYVSDVTWKNKTRTAGKGLQGRKQGYFQCYLCLIQIVVCWKRTNSQGLTCLTKSGFTRTISAPTGFKTLSTFTNLGYFCEESSWDRAAKKMMIVSFLMSKPLRLPVTLEIFVSVHHVRDVQFWKKTESKLPLAWKLMCKAVVSRFLGQRNSRLAFKI